MAKLAQYDIGRILGEGAFAIVRQATHRGTGQPAALKFVQKALSTTQEVLNELSILMTIGLHRNVACAMDTFELPEQWAIVLELVEGGEVFERIADKGPYSERDAALVIRQVGLALSHMHGLGVAHRDLKPENLLLTAAGDVKVADFGLASRFGSGLPPMDVLRGTPAYVAPEMIDIPEPGGYGPGVDLWATGCILYTLLCAYCAFDPSNNTTDEEILRRSACGEWSFGDPAASEAWQVPGLT